VPFHLVGTEQLRAKRRLGSRRTGGCRAAPRHQGRKDAAEKRKALVEWDGGASRTVGELGMSRFTGALI
jgi:hypothetical protein